MIPKTIHYCWFGSNPLPASAIKCIESWRKFFPDYEIKEWNEDNFDVDSIPYTSEAYKAQKYAFVSDYARFWILYKYGGIYFDTDVEVIRPMDDIIARGAFMGVEVVWKYPQVAPGLGIGVEPGHRIYKQAINHYKNTPFVIQDGVIKHESIVPMTTRLLIEAGLQPGGELQEVDGIWIYPVDYFNPFDDVKGVLRKTPNTRSIHWYAATWQQRNPFKKWLSRWVHRVFGLRFIYIISTWLKRTKTR